MNSKKKIIPFQQARQWARQWSRQLGIKSKQDWINAYDQGKLPNGLPRRPDIVYSNRCPTCGHTL